MNKENYPKVINDENIPELVKQAKNAKWKYYFVMYGTAIIYSILGLFIAPYLFSLSGQIVMGSYTPITMPNDFWLEILILALFSLIYIIYLLYSFVFLENALKRIIKLRYSELVFFECVLIVDNLHQGKTRNAINSVSGLVTSLFLYQRDFFNSKGRNYKPEIKKLRIGQPQIKRLILFSTKNISDLFANFGLAILNEDHPIAYKQLQKIIDEIGDYGKIEGLFDRIKGKATDLQIFVTIISLIVGIVSSLVLIITSFGT